MKKDAVYEALNKLRAAFLAAKDGGEVEKIIKGVLTHDERIKIGRRIQVAEMIKAGFTYEEIKNELKVGRHTIQETGRKISEFPFCFKLISERESRVEKEYRDKSYVKVGGPKMIFKRSVYTGFKRKDVKR